MDGLSATQQKAGEGAGPGKCGVGRQGRKHPAAGRWQGFVWDAGPTAARGLLGVHDSAFGTGSCLCSRAVPARHCSRVASRSARRGPRPPGLPSPVPASCHPQFHMSLFSLTFSNNPKNMWLTSETTHLFPVAKSRPRVTYCKALFLPDSNPYWSLLKSCVQFFHNCPHSNRGRQPTKH